MILSNNLFFKNANTIKYSGTVFFTVEMKYPFLCVLLAMLFFSIGCIGITGFSQYYTDFSRILTRNGADNQNLLPPTIEQLNGIELEMIAYQKAIEKQPLSADQQAIILLMETELNLVYMQQNILLAQEQTRFANLAFPSCEKSSNLGKALAFFDQAKAQATLAEKNSNAFLSDYYEQSQQTSIDFEILKAGILGSQQSIMQSKQTIENFCP